MIPSVFSSPVPIAKHQVKQAQAQGQSSSSQTGSSSTQSQQTQSTTSSKVVNSTAEDTHGTSAEMNWPVNAESGPNPIPAQYGSTAAERSFTGVHSRSSGEGYGSGVGEHGRSISSFPSSSQQQQQSLPSGDQQQMYLNTPELQPERHSPPPPNQSPYVEHRPQDNPPSSNSH